MPSLLSETTLRFWDWMSGHYCCSPGEVALAALPAGMRLASETKLQPAPDAEERDDSGLDDREFQVVEALRLRGAMTFREVGDLLGVKDPAPVLRSLVETGWILSNEEMKSGPGRKVVSMVRLSERAVADEGWLGEQLDALDARAPAQSRAMMALLDEAQKATGVPVVELVRRRDLDGAIFKRLVEKGLVFLFNRMPG